ncbi:hypothetical protein TNCV_1103241 [Trichonephila clavipes]|nr:hypothetical protein TNCV_1103241 [Trichonephila clavipes]
MAYLSTIQRTTASSLPLIGIRQVTNSFAVYPYVVLQQDVNKQSTIHTTHGTFYHLTVLAMPELCSHRPLRHLLSHPQHRQNSLEWNSVLSS